MTGTSLIWSALGWGMAALAVVFLLLAFLGDVVRRRFRRMRRCPKCWYDLSHTPGMTCSECGYTAKRERQLFRTRRRKRWVLVALLVWIGSYFAFRVPAMQQRGWVAAVPTTVLVFLWPRERVHYIYEEVLAHPELAPRFTQALAGRRFTEEMLLRIDRRELNRLHWRLLIETAIRTANHPAPLRMDEIEMKPLCIGMLTLAERAGRLNEPALLRRALTAGALRMATRTRWPVGEPMHAFWRESQTAFVGGRHYRVVGSVEATPLTAGLARVTADDIKRSSAILYPELLLHTREDLLHSRQCDQWTDYCSPLGTPSVAGRSIRYLLSVERGLTESQAGILGTDVLKADVEVAINCRIAGTIDDILTPVESPEFDAAMNERLRPLLHEDHIHLRLRHLGEVFEHLDGATFAATLELILDDEVVARGAAWWCVAPGPIATDGRPAPLVMPMCDYVPLGLSPPRRIDPNETRYRLRFTPDPRMALRRFESDVYWSGAIEVPVRPPPDGLRP